MHRTLFVVTLLATLNALATDGQPAFTEDTSCKEKFCPILRLDADELNRLPTREQIEGEAATLGPAPPLSYVEVYAVGSSNQGWEILSSPGLYTTQWDHGGAVLLVAVLEIGYGYDWFAKMNGGQIPWSSNYLTESLCWNGYGQLAYCSVGQTVAGFLRYFDISGPNAGQFTYQNTSTNSPRNTMSDWISIQ